MQQQQQVVPLPTPSWNSASPWSVVERLAAEVGRKLRGVARTGFKDDAQRVTRDVFVDLTGDLTTESRRVLQVAPEVKTFYELLAEYYAENDVAAEELLEVCRGTWGVPYVAAIFAMVLHKWLLEKEETNQRSVNVMVTGCRQLFWADVHNCTTRFAPLFETTFGSCRNPRRPFKDAVLPLIAQFLPHYSSPQSLQGRARELPIAADVLFEKWTLMLRETGAGESGLVRYLNALCGLRGSALLGEMGTVTALRFQVQLYSLTGQGGPRYPSREVQGAAFATLDALYPSGSRTRKLISRLFKIFHPLDWPRTTAWMVESVWSRCQQCFVTCFIWIALLCRLIMKPFFR